MGIIVALREEFRELRRYFPDARPVKDAQTGASDYLFEWNAGPEESFRCAAMFVGTMGPTEAALAAERFLNRQSPTTIVVLGIAAGIHHDVKLGDVVMATHITRYLDRAKIVP